MAIPKIQYLRTADGRSINCWTLGEGKPLFVLDTRSDGDIEWEWETPAIREWYELLARDRMLVGYGGKPLTTPAEVTAGFSPTASLRDIEAVVGRLGLREFSLFAPYISVAAAVRYIREHPDRVSHLILWAPLPARYDDLFVYPTRYAWKYVNELAGSELSRAQL